ncbi:M56 family metallopeptidase [Mucilaginibacter flavus]|uniref:M56 family metallopeptidase n=1 Tax=Mucilaginibacter flavus TaxID=931504 RepID=UPI0025B35959|nr:M56 family metallopeptidase [Mucilaginibacter flavus]MDN3580056.1 M56 family metallopeptidase [Mucilaginibacter flavus]
MPALFVFLLKVNIALLLFCAGYYLVLRHLTFYTLNRVYLLAAILFASIYPQINLTDFLQRHEKLARPVQRVVINWQAPAQALAQKVHQPAYWLYIEAVFWIGAVLLAIRLLVQLFSLYKLFKNSQPATIGDHSVRVMDDDAAPFSFWRSIFVNPAKHEPADLKAILLHEQVHVNQWHTADILLAELSSIFYWFNPGVWLMKRAIRENIEFITDQKILKKGIDSKAYQYSLVSVGFSNTQPGIVNHFNLSTIKKRIIMMNAKRSSKINLTRYAFMVPAVIGLLLVFSISKADFVKKSKAFKTITIISNNVGNAVGINKLTASIKSILPGVDTASTKTSANATTPMVFENNFADAVFYVDGVQVTNTPTGTHFTDDTESLDYIQAADAKKYFNIGDGKHTIAFATRQNTTAGIALRKKISQLVNSGKIKVQSVSRDALYRVNEKIKSIDSDIASHLSADTLKKSKHFFIVTNSDSSLVYVNGKKGKIKDVDPDDILSVNVFDAKGAAGFINEKVDDNTAVIFITTKNSAEGQKFKEKLDGYTGNNTAIAGAGVKGLNGMPLKGKVANVMVYNLKVDSKDSLDDNGSKGLRYTVNGFTNVTADDKKGAPGTFVIVKDTRVDKKNAAGSKLTLVKVTGKTTSSSGTSTPEIVLDDNATTGTGTVNKVYVTARKANTLQLVKSNVTVNGIPLSDSVVVMSDQNAPKTTTSKWKISYRTDVDNDKASPLILVDGKEVNQAEFKKVNPADIKDITVLKDDAAAAKKYGEKAKQGVIVIELKKKK